MGCIPLLSAVRATLRGFFVVLRTPLNDRKMTLHDASLHSECLTTQDPRLKTTYQTPFGGRTFSPS